MTEAVLVTKKKTIVRNEGKTLGRHEESSHIMRRQLRSIKRIY